MSGLGFGGLGLGLGFMEYSVKVFIVPGSIDPFRGLRV